MSALSALALALAGAAFAAGHHHARMHHVTSNAINTYTTTIKFSSKASGTAKKPAPISFTQDIKASGTNGNRTAVLLDLKTKIYGVVSNAKAFPTCSANAIAAAKNDTICPKGAKVASGYITATLGSAQNFQASGQSCDPLLDVWNSGPGKLTFFFVDSGAHQCLNGALQTGQVGPYPATVKQQGKYMVVDVPIPSFVDFPLGPGALAGSLETEHLVWGKGAKVHGKPLFASVACTGKTRPYSQSFKATLPSSTGGAGTTQSATVSHKAAC
ncbi:MAG: hypothetical protein ACYC0H_17475 [Solirubrobacteraceae bacterium]